jgi:hypothetical protein
VGLPARRISVGQCCIAGVDQGAGTVSVKLVPAFW